MREIMIGSIIQICGLITAFVIKVCYNLGLVSQYVDGIGYGVIVTATITFIVCSLVGIHYDQIMKKNEKGE